MWYILLSNLVEACLAGEFSLVQLGLFFGLLALNDFVLVVAASAVTELHGLLFAVSILEFLIAVFFDNLDEFLVEVGFLCH